MTDTTVVEDTAAVADDTVSPDKVTAGTVAATGDNAEPPKDAPPPVADPEKGYWPTDWRTAAVKSIADEKEREKTLKRLERYSSPDDVFKALREQDKKLSSGKFIEPLPDKPTEEQLKDWRSKNGIPVDVKDYKIELGDGYVIGDEDKGVLEAVLPQFQEANLTNAQANKVLESYYKQRQADAAALAEFDATTAKENEDKLRQEWGGEYRLNSNVNDNLLATWPEELRENVLNGRMADGTKIANSAEFRKLLNNMAREITPVSTVLNSGSGNPISAMEDRKTYIESIMGTSKYTKDEKIQAEYRDILTALEKHGKRA